MRQEDVNSLMEEIDRKCKLPKYWEEFKKQQTKEHNLIIKDNKTKELYCTHCGKTFNDKIAKVHEYMKCPNCNETYRIYGMNYYRKSFQQSIILVQRMNKKVIIRIFEVYSYFEKDSKKIKQHCIEYARIIPGIGKFIGNNVYINMYGFLRVYHGYKKINWYKYRGYKNFTDFPTYPYNRKKLIKNTIMEYAPINEFLDKFLYYGYNFLDTLELAAYPSFEMLWNMKLYNLSFRSRDLNKNGSFYKTFKVPKTFLKFMQDKDISYKELQLLQIFQKADVKLLQKYRDVNINYIKFLMKHSIFNEFLNSGLDLSCTNIKLLNKISKFIPLKKLTNYSKGLKNLNIYLDYLEMAKELALNYKSKKNLFPRNLIARHDKLQTKMKVQEDMETQFKTYLRYLELSKYTYDDDKYIIFPAPSVDDMKDEGTQQGNCVGYKYLNPYINRETEIYFIRELSNVAKSFITLEFYNGNVVQKELPHHCRNFTEEHNLFIQKWIGYRHFMDKREKYKNKHIEVIKYDLTKLVA